MVLYPLDDKVEKYPDICYDVKINCKRPEVNLFKNKLERLKKFIKHPFRRIKGKVKVGNPKWKLQVALEMLDAIQIPQFVEDLVKSLTSHFDRGHEQFSVKLKSFVNVLRRGKSLKDDQRKGETT